MKESNDSTKNVHLGDSSKFQERITVLDAWLALSLAHCWESMAEETGHSCGSSSKVT